MVQYWGKLWSKIRPNHWAYQTHFKSLLASITCKKTLRADPEWHSEPAQPCWVWVQQFTYLDRNLTAFVAFVSSLFSTNLHVFFLPQATILSHNPLSWLFSSTESWSHQPVTDTVALCATSLRCSSSWSSHNRGRQTEQSRIQEVSEETWRLQ